MDENNSNLENKWNAEIDTNYAAIKKLKKLIPFGILIGLAFAFLFPPLILSDGKPDNTPYAGSVIFRIVLFSFIYFFGYKQAVNKRKDNIKNLLSKIRNLKEA